MNTQYIKKNVIAKKLGELLTGTCQYSPDTFCRDDNSIEPVNMVEFRNILSELAEKHFQNILTVTDINDVLKYVEKIGWPIGHVTSRYTTGTWGVRYSTLQEIVKILYIKDFELLPVNSQFKYYDNLYILKSGYSVHSNSLEVEVQSLEYPESKSFEYGFNYSNIDIFAV